MFLLFEVSIKISASVTKIWPTLYLPLEPFEITVINDGLIGLI